MSVDIMPPTHKVYRQLEDQGHVYVPDVYDPGLGEHVGSELDLLFRCVKAHQVRPGELLRNSEKLIPDMENQPNLSAVLQAIGHFSSTVLSTPEHDRRLWPSTRGYHLLLQSIDMDPSTIRQTRLSNASGGHTHRVHGAWHVDREDIVDLIAITTYEGESRIQIEDTATHTLHSGGVVFFDNRRRPRLWHRGYADQPRRALGLATVRNKVL